jgi:hypothetical protein
MEASGLPPGWGDLAPVVPGVLGRLLYHLDQARRGRRPALGVLLLLELLIAVPMGFLGQGMAEWAGLADRPALACAIAISYVGPRAIEVAVELIVERLRRKPPTGSA